MNKLRLTIRSGNSASLVNFRIPHSRSGGCRTEIRSRRMSGRQGNYGVANLSPVLNVVRIWTVMTTIEPPSTGINLTWQSLCQFFCPFPIGHRHWFLLYSKIYAHKTKQFVKVLWTHKLYNKITNMIDYDKIIFEFSIPKNFSQSNLYYVIISLYCLLYYYNIVILYLWNETEYRQKLK